MENTVEKIDFLTGCQIRASLAPFVDKLIAESKAYNKDFTILLLDIDHFKSFNDKYGHLDGDQVLKYFASSMRLDLARTECSIFRFGGDEFVIVFPGRSVKDVREIARTLQLMLNSRPFLLGGKLFKMSFSGGIVSGSKDGDNLDELFARADKAMYVSKKMGRSRTIVYSRIWLEYLMYYLRAAAIVLVMLAIAGTAFLLTNPHFMDMIFSAKKPELRMGAIVMPGKKTARIHLKSGAVMKGRIIKENDREVEVSLALETGEGSISVQKSMINRIERE
ncbi:MAG: GGDEF domain-containing protein [Candidatus Omnitrophica bacterium]|nr:GGDEF domain-containing protein [Candidatus Omnitrophota bacterium]